MPDFSIRSNEAELMDDLNCSGEVIDQTLRELEVINKWLGGNHVTIDGIEKLAGKTPKLRIADIGCGGGDMLKLIAKWGRNKKLDLDLIGIDANPNIINFAKKNCAEFDEIRFETIDIFSEEFKNQEYDIITATLFTHHFESDELMKFYKQWSLQSRLGIVINDLHRHWFAYYSIKWITRLFSKSPMVKNDAPVSVMRSFLKKELIELMEDANIKRFKLRWMWAFRWQLIIKN